ncbi:DNA-binding transcriptional regulator, LysR family [Pseudoxanthobacter soli DSM 19599]|uniref:DNA-binding transcriptional regulator, LysR family n=1 Tax=Pseudoxanthobacter soli DSM 19599 TaxID=1123029 RepID=A0A1M7Z4S5_9HYPH|nr:LysR family transcriptional regulator [Pseudoxanthobacter soli]SHO59844.1 DNA-binding transcriptional regulator, LysR family [Pseudoxanthobacter soli DSM 19599]
MDIDQLRTFDRIVRDGSFTKAAARLAVTQATVSMRIRALEDALGGLLFERGRKVRLTERGATFLPYARRILSTVLEGTDAIRGAERGRIALATLRSLVRPLVSPVLVSFMAGHPMAEVVLSEGNHGDVAERVHDRTVDLAIMGWPNLDPLLDELHPLAVFRERVVMTVAADVAARLPVTPTIEDVFAVVPHFLTLGWWQVLPDAVAGLRLRAPAASTMPGDAGLALIRAGTAVGYMPHTWIGADVAAGRLVAIEPVDGPSVSRDSALVAARGSVADAPLTLELARRLVARGAAEGMLHRADPALSDATQGV